MGSDVNRREKAAKDTKKRVPGRLIGEQRHRSQVLDNHSRAERQLDPASQTRPAFVRLAPAHLHSRGIISSQEQPKAFRILASVVIQTFISPASIRFRLGLV